MVDEQMTDPLAELKSRFGVEVTTARSTRSRFTGQDEVEAVVEVTKLVLSGLSGAILAKVGEDLWNLTKKAVAAIFRTKRDRPRPVVAIEIRLSDPGKEASFEVVTDADAHGKRLDAFARKVTDDISGGKWTAGTTHRLSAGGVWIPEQAEET